MNYHLNRIDPLIEGESSLHAIMRELDSSWHKMLLCILYAILMIYGKEHEFSDKDISVTKY